MRVSMVEEPKRVGHALESVLGPEYQALLDQSLELSKQGISTGEIASKLAEGLQLTPEEDATYRVPENKILIDKLKAAGDAVFAEARNIGESTGARGENYWTTQRNLAARYLNALPGDMQGAASSLLKRVDRQRLHEDITPRFDAGIALKSYVQKVVRQQIYDPLIKDATALKETLQQLEDTGTDSVRGEVEFISNYIDRYIKGFKSPLDVEAFRRANRHIIGDSVAVGTAFKSKGLLDPLQPVGDIRVTRMDPRGRFQVTVDGKPSSTWYTSSDLLAMKHEGTLVNGEPLTAPGRIANGIAFYTWVGLRYAKFFPAAISNIGRSLTSESVGYVGQAAIKLGKIMADPVKRAEWLKEAGPADLVTNEMHDYLSRGEKPGKMQTLHTVAALGVALPDMLQKPIMYEAAKLRLAKLNPDWSPERIQTHALIETATLSDLAGKAFQAPAAVHPLGQMAYLFQKASLRTLDRINQIWSDPALSSRSRFLKLSAVTALPAAVWATYYHATGGDIRNVPRQSMEFLPFLNLALAFPGVQATMDAVSGKTVHSVLKTFGGPSTSYFDSADWVRGRPSVHGGEPKRKRKAGL